MQDNQSKGTQNGNGDNGNGQLPDLTNREILKVLLTEIADVRRELKQDIEALSRRMDGLEGRMDTLEEKVDTLRMEVHQNQTTFITNFDHLEKRVEVLEWKAA